MYSLLSYRNFSAVVGADSQGDGDASEHARSLAAFEEMLEFLVIRLVSQISLSHCVLNL